MKPQVVIKVRKGMAHIAYASPGVEVAIVDTDDQDAPENEKGVAYWVRLAKIQDGTLKPKVTVEPVAADIERGVIRVLGRARRGKQDAYAVYLRDADGVERFIGLRTEEVEADALANLLRGIL